VYPPYLEIEQALFTLAQQYDGSPGADIARLFTGPGRRWTTATRKRDRAGRSTR
jgi:hypothetical protein